MHSYVWETLHIVSVAAIWFQAFAFDIFLKKQDFIHLFICLKQKCHDSQS